MVPDLIYLELYPNKNLFSLAPVALALVMAQLFVCPLIKKAITAFNHLAFCYMYPYIFFINVDKNGLISVGKNPICKQTLPWIISITLITTVIGLGSCVLLCTSPMLSSNIRMEVYYFIMYFGLGSAAILELLATSFLYKSKIMFLAINTVFNLEFESKQLRIYYMNNNLN